MSTRRDQAMKLLDRELRPGVEFNSKKNPEAFYKLTGKKHDDLVASWKKGSIETSCNGFVGWYAGNMGITGIASWFKLESSLRTIGKGHAWVKSGSADPQPGDILHHTQGGTGLHVDVCIGFDGRKLIRAAAGQTSFKKPRNPDAEFDVLKRVTGTGPYNPANLLGWLDLDRFFAPAPAPSTTGWVDGWWSVSDGNQYYYHFGASGLVVYTVLKPHALFTGPKSPVNSGQYQYLPDGKVFIRWKAVDGSATEETFTPDDAQQTMSGRSNRYAPLRAKRM